MADSANVALALLQVALCAACGGATQATTTNERGGRVVSFPLAPCPGGERPEAVGVWQSADREEAFAYDGCTVRFIDYLTQEPAIFAGERNIARAFVVNVRNFADPFPYFRAREERQIYPAF